MLYDIRTSEKAATTLETLTGVNRTIWLAEQYKNYGRIDYTYADDDVRNIITKHGGHYPDLNDLEMVVTHITTSSEKCRHFFEVILTFVVEHNRCFIKEFFLPVAEQVRLDIIFGCKGIEIFLSLKQLDHKV